MKAAVTQPNYLPWLGYFDLLDTVDIWVVLDNVELSKRSYIVRNRIKQSDTKTKWLTVELNRFHRGDCIYQTEMKESDWYLDHLNKIESYYRNSDYFGMYFPWLQGIIPPRDDEKVLSEYNQRVILDLCRLLDIDIQTVRASDLVDPLKGTSQEKILTLCNHLSVSEYYTFQSGVRNRLYEPVDFKTNQILLYMQDYEHPVYHQQGNTFVEKLSIIDLLFNAGNDSTDIIRSGRKWERMN